MSCIACAWRMPSCSRKVRCDCPGSRQGRAPRGPRASVTLKPVLTSEWPAKRRTWEDLTEQFANEQAYAGGLGRLMNEDFEVPPDSTPAPMLTSALARAAAGGSAHWRAPKWQPIFSAFSAQCMPDCSPAAASSIQAAHSIQWVVYASEAPPVFVAGLALYEESSVPCSAEDQRQEGASASPHASCHGFKPRLLVLDWHPLPLSVPFQWRVPIQVHWPEQWGGEWGGELWTALVRYDFGARRLRSIGDRL